MDPAPPGLMALNERAASQPALSSFPRGRQKPFWRGAGLPSTPYFGVSSPRSSLSGLGTPAQSQPADYTGGETMRFAFSIASAYTSGRITGVNIGSVPANQVRTYMSSAILAGVSS